MLDLKRATESNFTKPASKAEFTVDWLGQIEYSAAYLEQLARHAVVTQNQNLVFILGCEHHSVITVGRRLNQNPSAKMYSGIPVVPSTRGGLMTLHSPGQLVIYPILDLRRYQLSVRTYVGLLLKCTEQLLQELRVPALLSQDQPGVFTETGKIAFCGVQVRQHVTLHGISINVHNDLSLFSLIESCGVQNQKFDQIDRYQSGYNLAELHRHWSRIFQSQIDRN